MNTKTALSPIIRSAVSRDHCEILAIDSEAFADAWSGDDLAGHLRRRNVSAYAAEHNRFVVGYLIVELFPERVGVLRLAVAEDHRRRGVGRQLLARVAMRLGGTMFSASRRTTADVLVPESHLGALLCLRECGWRATSTLRGYFGVDDGVLMELGTEDLR